MKLRPEQSIQRGLSHRNERLRCGTGEFPSGMSERSELIAGLAAVLGERGELLLGVRELAIGNHANLVVLRSLRLREYQ